MTKVEPILLIGAGGHCKSCIDMLSTLDKYQAVGIVDKKVSKSKGVFRLKIILLLLNSVGKQINTNVTRNTYTL